jgi:2-phosphosulfolactate phosphatase
MQRIDLVLRKEDINVKTIPNKIAVVFDVLLATSTVASLLHSGAKEVFPVYYFEEALRIAAELDNDNYVLVGEDLGKPIDGFLYPFPVRLKDKVKGKTVIFSTTNGTVALKNASSAHEVYAGSILNERALANYLVDKYDNEPILLICSGSAGRFNLEDFFGAGSFLNALLDAGANRGLEWDLSDAALAALYFYKGNKENDKEVLQETRIGKKLILEGYRDEVLYTLNQNACPVIPRLEGNLIRPAVSILQE